MGLLFYVTYTFAFVFGTEQAAQRAEVEGSYLSPFACMFRVDCGIHGSEVMVCIYGVILTAQFIALMNPGTLWKNKQNNIERKFSIFSFFYYCETIHFIMHSNSDLIIYKFVIKGLNAINLGRTAAVEIYSTIHRPPVIDGTDAIKGTSLGTSYDGSMELKKVVFSYPTRPGDLLFANFSLKIKAGSSVALVGPSGSGKSTLSKLILRLYDPIGGQVLAGGTPLTELNLKWWRSQIGYVAQEPSLFPGSIRDNIAAGKLNTGHGQDNSTAVTHDEIVQAAKAASAHEFITDLPDGYDTFYSGSSIQLSGESVGLVPKLNEPITCKANSSAKRLFLL